MAQYVNWTPVVKDLGLDLGPHPPQCSHTSLSHTVPESPAESPCSLFHTSDSCSYYTHFHMAHNSHGSQHIIPFSSCTYIHAHTEQCHLSPFSSTQPC